MRRTKKEGREREREMNENGSENEERTCDMRKSSDGRVGTGNRK